MEYYLILKEEKAAIGNNMEAITIMLSETYQA